MPRGLKSRMHLGRAADLEDRIRRMAFHAPRPPSNGRPVSTASSFPIGTQASERSMSGISLSNLGTVRGRDVVHATRPERATKATSRWRPGSCRFIETPVPGAERIDVPAVAARIGLSQRWVGAETQRFRARSKRRLRPFHAASTDLSRSRVDISSLEPYIGAECPRLVSVGCRVEI